MRHLLGSLTILLALTGCSSDSEARPAEPVTTTRPGPATPAAEELGDPLRFFSSGRTVVRCFPDGDRRIMTFDQVRPRRPVTLTGVTGGGDATTIVRTWVAPLAAGEIDESGNIDLDAGGTQLADVDTWADREPLRGAALEPGTTYTFFLSTTLRPDRGFDDFLLAWDDGATTGESAFDHGGRTRSGGC